MIFSASSVPGISIIDYLERIQTYSNLEKNTLISSLIFIDRFCELSKTTLTYYNIHRILFASIIIAIKYNEDSFYDNKYYSEIAGVNLKELKMLEYSFTTQVNFNLFTREELNLIEEAFVLMSDFQFFISDDIFENYNRYLTSFKNMT